MRNHGLGIGPSGADLRLRENEERLRLATHTGKVGIWDWDILANSVTWTDSLYEIHGVDPALFQPTLESFQSLVHPDDFNHVSQRIEDSLSNDAPYEVVFRALRPDGGIVFLLTNAVVMRRDDGTPIRLLGATVDITQLRAAEEALRESEERYRLIAESCNDSVWDWDIEQDVVIRSNGIERLLGYSIDEIPPESSWGGDKLHPDDRDRVIASRQRACAGTASEWTEEFRLRRADGVYIDARSRGKIIRDATGRAVRMVGSLTDITKQNEMLGALRASEQRYRELVEYLPAAIYACDPMGKILLFNDAAVDLWGRTPVLGEEWWCGSHKILDAQGQPISLDECPMAVAMRERRPLRGVEIIIERPDGSRRHVLPHPEPMFTENGELAGCINMLVDITERKAAELALAATRDDLAEQVQALARLHELASTLTGSIELHPALKEILETLMETAGAKAGLLSLFDSGLNCLTPVVSLGAGETGDGPAIGITSACDIAYISGNRQLVSGEVTVAGAAAGRAVPYRAIHSTPIVTRTGNRLGAISLLFAEPHVPRQRELQMADLCARHAADMVESSRARQVLRESEQRFRNIADTAPVILGMVEPDGSNSFLSREFYAFTGMGEDECAHLGWFNAIHPDDVGAVAEIFARGESEVIALDFRLRHHSGEYRWVAGNGRARRGPEDELLGYIGSLVDITERKKAEEVLRSANDELERRVADRTEELRRLAFELTQTELRERKRLAQALHDDIQQILVAIKMQVGMARHDVNDPAPIHDAMRLSDEALAACRALVIGLSPPVLRDTDLNASLRWLVRFMSEQHGLKVDAKIDQAPALDEDFRCLLFEVTRELLFNVVKHAGVDQATLELGRTNGHVWIEVADRGRGCDTGLLQKPGRDSFGLLSVRERLNGLGGVLCAEGEIGKGCRIRASVPVGSEEQGQTESSPQPVQDNKPAMGRRRTIRVLIADDHQILRQGLAKLLASQPDTQVVGQASDGLQAVELARKYRPDVVVMDISMPHMTGIEATRVIKSEMPDVQVIALSMHDSEEMVQTMFEAGVKAYVSKAEPIEELLERIRTV